VIGFLLLLIIIKIRIMKVLLILCSLLVQALAFAPVPLQSQVQRAVGQRLFVQSDPTPSSDDLSSLVPATLRSAGVLAGFTTGALSLVQSAWCEEIEYAELPPTWVPVLFGIGLIVGVGLLTGSLGDVINEEALLGMQSGARAKKDIERARSSYFKKK
jgi:hypothetical protein